MRLQELFSQKLSADSIAFKEYATAIEGTAPIEKTDKEVQAKFMKSSTKENTYIVSFVILGGAEKETTGFNVFSSAFDIIREFVKKYNPTELVILPHDEKRKNIYQRMISKDIDRSVWNVSTENFPMLGTTVIVLSKKD